MTATGGEADAVEQALSRATLYELLGLGFGYPDAALFRRLRQGVAEAEARAQFLGQPMAEGVHSFAAALANTDPQELAVRHTALFDRAVACSPCETAYLGDPFAKVRQLADIAGFYRAFGLEVSTTRRPTPDHIGTELEFMSLLCRKQAYALVAGWPERAAIAAAADHRFLEDHLGRWVGPFCAALRRELGAGASDNYYAALAGLCELFVELELAAFGLRPERLADRRPDPDAALPAACGPGAACG